MTLFRLSISKLLALCLLLTVTMIACSDSGDGSSMNESSSDSGATPNADIVAMAEQGDFVAAMQEAQQLKATQPAVTSATLTRIVSILENRMSEVHNNPDATDQQKADLHYDLGIYHEYYASDMEMRPRMTTALQHFRRVLELRPGDQDAQGEIDQIEGVYKSLGRDIPEGVAE